MGGMVGGRREEHQCGETAVDITRGWGEQLKHRVCERVGMRTLTAQTPCVRESGHADTHSSNTVCVREWACRHSQLKHRVCERVGMRTLTGQTPCV